MRVAVLGSGAMGAIFGAALLRAGDEVVFFDRRADVVEAINRDGLKLSGVMGQFTLRPSSARGEEILATSVPDALGKVDIALVLVDSNATAAVAVVAERCLKPDGFALTLQNGIGNWEALAETLGPDRVLAGSTYNSGANLGPGVSAHTNLGMTVLGELDGKISARATSIARRFAAAGLPTEVSGNVEGHVWSKFVHNCAINPVAAVTGLRVGEIARDPAAAKLLDLLLEEILRVVAGLGIILSDADPREEMRDHCWRRYNRPSMLQHIESGRGTEIDALNGALVKRAEALGIPVPVNETMVAVVKALEAAGRRNAATLDEKALEAAAQADPRRSRWGEG